jgi:hypothetical protein
MVPVSSGTSTIPWSVPRAMVNTGTPSALASVAASIGWVRPWVLAPSESSSTTSGGSWPDAGSGGSGAVGLALASGVAGGRLTSRARSIPSPMAVAPSACRDWMAS